MVPIVTTQWKTKTYTYVPNTHRLATAGAEQLGHDAAGNLTSASDPLNAAGPGQQFVYSAANRMKSANGADYAYTGMGERV